MGYLSKGKWHFAVTHLVLSDQLGLWQQTRYFKTTKKFSKHFNLQITPSPVATHITPNITSLFNSTSPKFLTRRLLCHEDDASWASKHVWLVNGYKMQTGCSLCYGNPHGALKLTFWCPQLLRAELDWLKKVTITNVQMDIMAHADSVHFRVQ